MSAPFRYIKPLTREQEFLVECVTTRYEGVDAPFVKFEDDNCVTLMCLEKIRPTFLAAAKEQPAEA